MSSYLKNYKITLVTRAPVFIGSDRMLSKKEYILDRESGIVYVPDFNRMIQFFRKNNLLDVYEQYILQDERELADWLLENKITSKDYLQWSAYSLSASESILQHKKHKNISTFMKDAYGCPFVPGSTVKGAFRTALLAKEIAEHPQSYERDVQGILEAKLLGRRKTLSYEKKTLENKAFCKIPRQDKWGRPILNRAANDIMSGIRVGDSRPLDCSCLVLCQKVDETISGKLNELPQLRECIRPGTKIELEMGIDTTLTNLTEKDILQAVNLFCKKNYENVGVKFKGEDRPQENSLIIGGGTGYQTKTVTHQLLEKCPRRVSRVSAVIGTTMKPKLAEKQKRCRDVEVGAAPHVQKRTIYENKRYTMGLCELSIEPVAEQ